VVRPDRADQRPRHRDKSVKPIVRAGYVCVLDSRVKSRNSVISLRHNGRDVFVTPLDERRRVECGDQLVESEYLEYAIAHVLEIDGRDAVPIVTRLLEEYLDQSADGEHRDNVETPAADAAVTAPPENGN
jgi:hypothetical protein